MTDMFSETKNSKDAKSEDKYLQIISFNIAEINDIIQIKNFLINAKIIFYLKDYLTLDLKSDNPQIPKEIINQLSKNILKLTYDSSDDYNLRKLLESSEFRKIFVIFVKFLNNSQNDQNTNLSLNQELSNILSKEPYSINQITVLTEYIKFYHTLSKIYSSLYQYLNNIRNFYSSQLWPLENKKIKMDENFLDYYTHNYQTNRYLNRYVKGNRIFRIAFLENKISRFVYHLINLYLKYIDSSEEYLNFLKKFSLEINKPVLYRGIHSQLAKNIMNLKSGDIITFKGFQSQTYDYEIAKNFNYFYNIDSIKYFDNLENYDFNNIGMILNFEYLENFKFLCFNREEREVLTYPNCRYQIEKIYFNKFVITCDLRYLDHNISENENEINLKDFDLQFLRVLEYLNFQDYYINWFNLYMYFLEHIDQLEKIIENNNLEIAEIAFSKEKYVEEFENYINNSIGMQKVREVAFKSLFTTLNNSHKFNTLIDLSKILNSEVMVDIENYINTHN